MTNEAFAGSSVYMRIQRLIPTAMTFLLSFNLLSFNAFAEQEKKSSGESALKTVLERREPIKKSLKSKTNKPVRNNRLGAAGDKNDERGVQKRSLEKDVFSAPPEQKEVNIWVGKAGKQEPQPLILPDKKKIELKSTEASAVLNEKRAVTENTNKKSLRNRKLKTSKDENQKIKKTVQDAGHKDAGDEDGRQATSRNALDAGELDGGSPEENAIVFYAKYHGNETPLAFEVEVGGNAPHVRAEKASAALVAALDADVSRAHLVPRVEVEHGVIAVWIGKSLITQFYPADAEAAGLKPVPFAENLDAKLKSYVPAQLRRRAVQLFALHFFLSVFFGVAGFLTLRFLRASFNRWDEEFDERRGELSAISVFKIPIFSSDAVGGTLAFALAVGRITSYVMVVSVSLGAMLSQFSFTRPILKRVVGWSAGPILKAVEDVITSVPGLIFVAIAIVSLRGLLRVMNLLLDGVSKKRLTYKPLPPSKVPVFRFVVSAASVLLFSPLLVAAGFGRWGTPWEILAIAFGLAVVVASIPQIANYVMGVSIIWREGLNPGDWVEVGEFSGEITHIAFHELSLVPEGGGTILVPMIYLVNHPLHRLREPPAVSFELTVARDRPAKELMKALRAAVKATDSDAKAECIDICHAWIRVRVSAPSIRPGVQEMLLMALSDAVDAHEFELPIRQGFTRRDELRSDDFKEDACAALPQKSRKEAKENKASRSGNIEKEIAKNASKEVAKHTAKGAEKKAAKDDPA